MSTHQEVQMSLAEFDRSQLPEDQRELTGDAFREAIREHLAAQFANEGGAAQVIISEDRIIIRWTDSTQAKPLSHVGIDQLTAGELEKGIATLRVALERNPHDQEAQLNLGMALTEQGALEESAIVLENLLRQNPGHAPVWVARGVAQARMHREQDAIASFHRAVTLSPSDGYARKNLGAILARNGKLTEAIEHLHKAIEILPHDSQAWLNYGMALEQSHEWNQADLAYQKVLRLDPNGEVGRHAEEGLTRIAASNFRKQNAGVRPDAMSYCLGALQRFHEMPRAEVQKITFEAAMLGSRGLDVNDPAEKYTLQSIAGTFSGLHLVCIQYVGFQILEPSLDLGFDLSAEYQAALQIHQGIE